MSIEEWWGRTFEGRGAVGMNSMPDSSPATILKLSTEDVCELIRSEDDRSVRGLLAHHELRRREDWTGRAALVISIIAIIVAALHR
jgi:hypothetical protein